MWTEPVEGGTAMRHRTKSTRVMLAAALIFGVVPLATNTARADCLSVEVRVWTSGSSTPTYPAGLGPKKCVVPTPFPVGVEYGRDTKDTSVPPGDPNGIGFTVWLPVPP
jgi:hypothetical protein